MVVGHCRKYKHKRNEATIGHIIIGVMTQLRGPDQSVMLPSVQCIRMDQWEVLMWVRVKQPGLTLTLEATYQKSGCQWYHTSVYTIVYTVCPIQSLINILLQLDNHNRTGQACLPQQCPFSPGTGELLMCMKQYRTLQNQCLPPSSARD